MADRRPVAANPSGNPRLRVCLRVAEAGQVLHRGCEGVRRWSVAWAGAEHVGSAVEHGEAGGVNGARARAGVRGEVGRKQGESPESGEEEKKLIGPFDPFSFIEIGPLSRY